MRAHKFRKGPEGPASSKCITPRDTRLLYDTIGRAAGLTVTELAKILNMSVSRVSHQLRILREHNLVSAKKINRETLYTLANHRIKNYFPF